MVAMRKDKRAAELKLAGPNCPELKRNNNKINIKIKQVTTLPTNKTVITPNVRLDLVHTKSHVESVDIGKVLNRNTNTKQYFL